MNLVILINGNLNQIININKIDNFTSSKIDEKDLVKFNRIRMIIKNSNSNRIYFACKDIEFQRFIIFLKIYILFTTRIGSIIDENGVEDNYSFIKLFFNEIPMLFVEIVFSMVVVIYHYLKMPFLKWIIYKKN
jgi:hypothetical protein